MIILIHTLYDGDAIDGEISFSRGPCIPGPSVQGPTFLHDVHSPLMLYHIV